MAEETNDGATPAETGTDAETAADGAEFPPFVLSGQYIRDLSFEAPKTPQVFALMQEHQPDIKINVDVKVQPLQEKLYEVVLKVEANCQLQDTTAFIMELSYAGLFNVNVPHDALHRTLLVECPKLLFPFVRYLVTDITREGGFPPLMMGLVDFEAMFQSEVQRLQAAQQAGEGTAPAPEKPAEG